MFWRETATLVKVEKAPDDDGYKTPIETRREVFVDKQSAKRSEFYAARQTGDKIALVLLVRAADYEDETRVEFGGKPFDVLRAYTRAGEIYELNCVEAAEEPSTATQTPAGGAGEEARA